MQIKHSYAKILEELPRVCERHGPYSATRFETFGIELESPCPECNAEICQRWELQEAERLSALERQTFERQNIEPEFYGATLGNYQTDSEGQEKALVAVLSLVQKKRGFVVLSGSFGVGKTHLACAAAKELGGAIYTMFEISMRVRCTYAPRARETEHEVLKELSALPFLAIDEVGRSKAQEAEANWLSHIIDKRCARFLPTMILSNKCLARDLPKEQWGESLEAILGDDVAQRIKSCGVVIALEGKNWRET